MKTIIYLFVFVFGSSFSYAQLSKTNNYIPGRTKAEAKEIASIYQNDMNAKNFYQKAVTKNSEDDYTLRWNRTLDSGSQSDTQVRYQFYDDRVTVTIINPQFVMSDGKRYNLSSDSPLETQRSLFQNILNIYHTAFFNYINIKDYLSLQSDKTQPSNLNYKISTQYKPGMKTTCVSGDCQNGLGVADLGNEEFYVGYFSQGKMNGAGMMYHKKFKFMISGFYKNNLMDGIIYEIRNGVSFSGYVSQGIPQGDGFFIKDNMMNGGNFQNGKIVDLHPYIKLSSTPDYCQFGTCSDDLSRYTYADGSFYIGFYKGGKKTMGIIDYKNGDSYVGEFSNDKLNGQAFFNYNNREIIFIGNYINGVRDGKGIELNLATLKGKGINYNNGKVISSTAEIEF